MSIAVLDKAFSTLEVLARTGRALTLAELAEESRLPKPTLHRILRSLRDLGYVTQNERSAYELTERLESLRVHGRDAVVRDKALPLMRRLHKAFDETVNLALLEGIYVRYVHVLETTQALRWIVKPGARDAFHTTALGRAVVAHLPGEQQARLVTKACATVAAKQRRATRAKLEQELRATRERGCALDDEETSTGVACTAISLTALGEPLVAISVSVPVSRFTPALRAALIKTLKLARDNPAEDWPADTVNL